MDADKYLTKQIPKILTNPNDNHFFEELIGILLKNIGYLILYAMTTFIIETIGKLAIKNAINKTIEKILKTDLSKITKKQYEHDIVSVVHHSENISSAIRNLFIEFPRKIIACYHFLMALKELSVQIMLYCILVNILFVLLTVSISYGRKYLLSKVIDLNIDFNIICTDLSNSIQTYKIDNRLNEYQNRINRLTTSVWYNSSMDSLMVASNDAVTSFSSQFMVGFISYMCRPMVISKSIAIEDLMYGIRSSSKFIEKLIGILEYFGDVVRQYKSFNFFLKINESIVGENIKYVYNIHNIHQISITTPKITKEYLVSGSHGRLIRFVGENGVGKTTLLLKFLGIVYNGATSMGHITAFNIDGNYLPTTSYRNNIAFVQQHVPLTYDSVGKYIQAVAGCNVDPVKLIDDTLIYFNITDDVRKNIVRFIVLVNMNKSIRDLSGGQAKFVQILAAITKLYVKSGNILILDEPSNNLDTEKVDHIKKLFVACVSKNITIMMVTHDDRMVSKINCENIEL
jgi:ABC-type bacteriocin/lantibiotic exporter with double-glycine peptidase domain